MAHKTGETHNYRVNQRNTPVDNADSESKNPVNKDVTDVNQIMDMIPHRYPFDDR